ncbi:MULTISPECIES: ATP-binding protein [Halorhodospira]|uniref:ATP-binding response regulator n=1 Tax=Halorhodospira TaxID=85108 RepID=UPI001EE98C8C|nr:MULTISPECIES: ATP-binding protein [Halorhodospira]MCG5526777.1 Hpt domain-containing protein [Halorhodospira halophila]MCG5542886.1 Hpt domain-containing protein [Halorhodospira sp. 9628]
MDERRTKALGVDPRRELTRLLPELRDSVSAAAVRLQEVGDEPGALTALHGELQRLHGGFLFVGVRELEHLSAELRAAAGDLERAYQAPETAAVEAQPLRAALMDAVLRLPRAIERIAVRAEDPVAELASLIDGLRRARGGPRYDSLALLRQCLDPGAPEASGGAGGEAVRTSRLAYQRGLLELIRGDERQALGQLRGVLEPLEATLGDSAAGSVCWSALAVLDLLDQGDTLDPVQKRAIAAYDRELRRLVEQGADGGLPEPSMAEALLQPLTEAPGSGRVAQVQAAARRLPGATLAMPAPVEDEAGSAARALVRSDVDLQALFYAEVGPALSQIGAALQRWRAGDPEAGLAIQRILHTLKGGARFAGLTEFFSRCHELEGEVATALADGATAETGQRLRHGLEQLADSVGVLRREVLGGGAEASAGAQAYDYSELWAGEDGDAQASTADAWGLQSGTGAEVLGDALATELAESAEDAGGDASTGPAGEAAAEPGLDPAAPQAPQPDYDPAPGADRPSGLSPEPDPAPARATLEPHVDAFDRLVHATAGECGRRVELMVEGASCTLPEGHLVALGPALEHLLRNAVRHGIEPPEARAAAGKPEVGRVALSLHHGQDEALLVVSDDGAGLDSEALQRQVSDYDPNEPTAALSDDEALSLICLPGVSTLDPEGEPGAGMGMDEVAGVVHELGGTLEMQSAPGAGTRFTLRLPMPGASAPEQPAGEASARPRVLVLDDSRTMRRITGHRLARQGFDPEGAAGLEEAHRAVAAGTPRALLVDLEMEMLQHEEGLGVLQRLVAEAGIDAGTLVAVSTRAVDQERLAAAGLGAARVLLKPYDEGQLADALAQACAASAGVG